MEKSLIEKAVRIAVYSHNGQTRKESDLPYIAHPFSVAFKLVKYGFPDTVIAAALVHDVLEDTKFTEDELHRELGEEVFKIVKAVTNGNAMPWEEKKKEYIENVRRGSEGAKAVAVADKVHNCESLLIAYKEIGPSIWEKFNANKDKKIWFEDEMLKMLKETWKHPLVDEYEKLLLEIRKLGG